MNLRGVIMQSCGLAHLWSDMYGTCKGCTHRYHLICASTPGPQRRRRRR